MRRYNEKMDGKKVLLAAHRGDRTNFPENTMIAMEAAVALNADMIETDVHMTKDGYLVLIHDNDVKRTTNGTGLVTEMTLEEVKNLDAGSWKDEKFTGTKIPTVEEFLEYISGTELTVNWELKDYPKDVGEERAYECADKLAELIERYHMTDRSMMNSFSEKVLCYVTEKYPGKFVIHGQGIHTCSRRVDVPEKEPETFFDWVCMYNKTPEHPAGVQEDYEYALAHDMIPCICFEDREDWYQAALDLGCRMFTSDNPGKGIEILKKLGMRE